jgi:hypothetical protein
MAVLATAAAFRCRWSESAGGVTHDAVRRLAPPAGAFFDLPLMPNPHIPPFSARSLCPHAPASLRPWLELYWPFVGAGLGSGLLISACFGGAGTLTATSAVLWASTAVYTLHQARCCCACVVCVLIHCSRCLQCWI